MNEWTAANLPDFFRVMGWLAEQGENGQAVIRMMRHTERALREAHAENEQLRGALYTIARGVWTAPNSIETIVWTARQALKPAD